MMTAQQNEDLAKLIVILANASPSKRRLIFEGIRDSQKGATAVLAHPSKLTQ